MKMKSETKELVGKILKVVSEIIVLIAVSFFGITAMSSLTACGSLTKASIRQIRPNSSVSVTITTNNPSEINVNPDTNFNDK